MAVLDRVGNALSTLATDSRRDEVVQECRHCSHARADDAGPCPICGQRGIATFLVD